MTGLDHACDAMDLVTATVCAVEIVVHGVFVEDLVDGRAPTRGVNFTELVVEIADQQGRYAVGHGLSPPKPLSFVIDSAGRSVLRKSALTVAKQLKQEIASIIESLDQSCKDLAAATCPLWVKSRHRMAFS
jgi:hypothetical protein